VAGRGAFQGGLAAPRGTWDDHLLRKQEKRIQVDVSNLGRRISRHAAMFFLLPVRFSEGTMRRKALTGSKAWPQKTQAWEPQDKSWNQVAATRILPGATPPTYD